MGGSGCRLGCVFQKVALRIIAEGVFLEGQGCYDGMLCSCLGMLHCCAGQFWPCVTVPHGALDNLGGVSLCRADRHGTGSTCAVRHLAHTAHPAHQHTTVTAFTSCVACPTAGFHLQGHVAYYSASMSIKTVGIRWGKMPMTISAFGNNPPLPATKAMDMEAE